MICISIIFINYVLYYATCVNYLPRFESLPPPLVYYAENNEDLSRLLTCKAWPHSPKTEINFYSTKRPSSVDANDPGQYSKSEPLHPLDSQYIEGHSVVVRSVSQARILSKLDLHCLVNTTFGAVISRPFRVVEARLGTFPSSTIVNEARKVIKYFMHGNVAFVDCNPPISFPPAIIEFTLNDTAIKASQRYKFVKRPNSQRVTLLIQAFEPRDQGWYRCVATNRVTNEIKIDPLVHVLKIKSPSSRVPVSIKMNIFGRELIEGRVSAVPEDVISVREGMNVTLFCVMEGAPPPSVTTFKLRSSPSSQQRHVSDKEFGLLSITRVSVDDEDSYLCSESSSSDTAQLKVQKRLSITQGPKDIRVNELGSQARFTCLSNDANITPQWYFNGRIRSQSIQAGQDSSLHIADVRKEDLGVYQCVARSKDEWVTQVASLSLKGDVLLTADEDANNGSQQGSMVGNLHGDTRGSRIKKNVDQPLPDKLLPQEELVPPEVNLIGDNFAVLVTWQKGGGTNAVMSHYRLQYRSRKGDSTDSMAIQTLEDEIKVNYFYVTQRHLKTRYVFSFRITMVLISDQTRYSQWSRDVSFMHIYPVQPLIQRLQSFNTSHVRVQWQYTHTDTYPISEYKLLVRKVSSLGSRDHYSKFQAFLVSSARATEAFVGPLDAGQRYQVVVYGIKESAPRKITMYSAEAAFETPASDTSSSSLWPGKNGGESNTRLMFVILGSLAGLMVLVIVVLVLMCYCRERKSVVMHRLNRYKDPAKLIHSSEQAKAVLLASISAPIGKQQTPTDVMHGEHASLLSTGPDAVYYQQKRQPPSGGSGHDMSDGEGASMQDQSVMQESGGMQHHMHPSAGMLTPQPPAITYYKTAPGPASLPAGSLMRQSQQQQFSPQRYSPGFQYAPQIMYTNAGVVYAPGSYLGTMYAQQQQHMQGPQRQEDLRSQDGGESVYSYFSQTSNNNCQRQMGMQGTVETGSQTMNSNGSAGHRHHRRKRRKTAPNEGGDICNGQGKVRGLYPGAQIHGQREVMYDIPPVNHHDPRMIGVPPGMVLMQPGLTSNGDQCWGQVNNTLTRRGTPTLFVEPPRIRDYSEYGIPHNQMMVAQPQQLAHLSQQNLHLHNQNLSGGYRDAQA